MTLYYTVGLGASAVCSIATLFVKSAITKYPGSGDCVLFYLISSISGAEGIAVLYLAKTLLAMLLFTLFFPIFRDERTRFWVALAFTTIILVIMSLGEVVIA